MPTTNINTTDIQVRLLQVLTAEDHVWHRDDLIAHLGDDFDPNAIEAALDDLASTELVHVIVGPHLYLSERGRTVGVSVNPDGLTFEDRDRASGVGVVEDADDDRDRLIGVEGLAPDQIGKAP